MGRAEAVRLAVPLLAANLALTACVAGVPTESGPTKQQHAVEVPCERGDVVERGVECRSVTVDDQDYRYGVFGQAGDPSHVVLVDLGGPGRTLFTSTEPSLFSQKWTGDEGLLFLEEPWVTAEETSGCRGARRAFYRSLFGEAEGHADKAGELVSRCHLGNQSTWGWSPGRYRKVVSKVLASEGFQLRGVVGHSFGALRVSNIWDSRTLEWAILSNSAPRPIAMHDYLPCGWMPCTN